MRVIAECSAAEEGIAAAIREGIEAVNEPARF
jgi:hypothetical protein